MAWLPDRQVYGPERPTVRDVEPLNRVFSEAFTDRYRRDGMSGVRVPHLNPAIWRYALEDAGDGAMIWRDADGELCGFSIVHLSGREGWMGPLAVRPDRQGNGLGKTMIRAGIAWLKDRGARTIGLETMPRTIENIGFYSRLGFVPGHLTITLTRDLGRRPALHPEVLSTAGPGRAARLEACRALTDRLCPGTDFTRELAATADLRIGDTLLLRDGEADVVGFALYHTAPLAVGRPQDELRVLKLVAEDEETFERLMAAAEAAALAADIRRVSVRCQTAFGRAYLRLIHLGYRTHWTDLRMTLEGHPERAVPEGAVLWSNWEI
ncbi:MAG TPA: GNAT family N-acetyltransferase [Gemmatimonadales bacterium]|nr:GNAT family N-acetyltransferase [Gemmatimonadales bacterium]